MTAPTRVLAGTLACWRLPARSDERGPMAECACGWRFPGLRSNGQARREHVKHVVLVRRSLDTLRAQA